MSGYYANLRCYYYSDIDKNGGNGCLSGLMRRPPWNGSAVISNELPNLVVISIHSLQHVGQVGIIGPTLAVILGYRTNRIMLESVGT